MDLSKNTSQNVYNDGLKDDSCLYQPKHIAIVENENVKTQNEKTNILGELCVRSIAANDPNSIIKSENETKVLVKELVPENVVASRKEKSEEVDEVETIEKIAEMVAICNKDSEDSSPKIKKRLKVLMSRNHSFNVFSNSDDSVASIRYLDRNNSPQETHDNIDQFINKSLNDQSNKKRKVDTNSPKNKSNEILEGPNLKKSPFEEIEDKLEEMFAGIEDEQLTNSTDEKNIIKKCDDSLDQCTINSCISSSSKMNKECSIESCKEFNYSASAKSMLSTKGAENFQNTIKDNKSALISKSTTYIKKMAPQRRLSIGMRKELLKRSNEELFIKKGNDNIDKEVLKPDTQNLSPKQVKKNISSNKNSKQNKSCKYKKDMNFVKSHTSSSKKIIRKCETPNKAKQHRQKVKESRTQRLQSSENDAEEKPLQPKDIESKNRSPFILVKNNGSISVINTVTPDELNEKTTRSKKHYNYAYERKTVKGCYSSTLGNRYDADTADSSWKCVFCKLGPHKKRLGDLFGPYVISSDCDEYRSIKDSFERLQRSGSHHINFSSNTLHKFNNVTSNSHNQNIVESSYEDFFTNHTSGMSQVSANCYEIWVHEDCAVWAPNIFVVGSRLAGLEEAAWKSTRYECVYCLKKGALLCCLQRGCKTTSHVPCAREFKWLLDESKFWVYCNKHTLNNIIKKN